ncbi:hypothetical protein QC761_403875 [Podospora bellae-mahoneyi]|uniref:Uncharacterized protein n=1 Tax=Podospora bellae-mahoneyi TaxID=2093777 RepID=A0ABR0FHC6_9PEZI|nr:hypothetical protein QC761_403875 [Podospora bellae-mahoneyi]
MMKLTLSSRQFPDGGADVSYGSFCVYKKLSFTLTQLFLDTNNAPQNTLLCNFFRTANSAITILTTTTKPSTCLIALPSPLLLRSSPEDSSMTPQPAARALMMLLTRSKPTRVVSRT